MTNTILPLSLGFLMHFLKSVCSIYHLYKSLSFQVCFLGICPKYKTEKSKSIDKNSLKAKDLQRVKLLSTT